MKVIPVNPSGKMSNIQITDEDRAFMAPKIAQLKMIKAALEKKAKKPRKPIGGFKRSVTPRYQSLVKDYRELITEYNDLTQAQLLSTELIIDLLERILNPIS